jgi:hypothetical protein
MINGDVKPEDRISLSAPILDAVMGVLGQLPAAQVMDLIMQVRQDAELVAAAEEE